MESSKLKIFLFCYGNAYMLRGEKERVRAGGRRERYHHVSPNTNNKEGGKRKGGGRRVQ